VSGAYPGGFDMLLINTRSGEVITENLVLADTFISRLVGLLNKKVLADSEALYISPCNSIHTFFMRFPIDACFVNAEMEIIKQYSILKPWRISAIIPGARGVFEFPAGTLNKCGLAKGDKLQIKGLSR
jgi:uncharacterized membrane protein (UPF0127 family)